MTNAEFKRTIAESPNVEWFNKQQATFNFKYIDFEKKLIGISSIYEFINRQLNGWNKIETKLPTELNASKEYFKELHSQLITLVKDIPDEYYLENHFQGTIIPTINNLRRFPLIYDSSITEFLINVFNENPKYFIGAFNFIIKDDSRSGNNKEYFIGYNLAYEFISKDYSKILERRNAEKSSIAKIRNDFEKYLSDSETQISDYLSNTHKKYIEYSNKIDDLHQEKNTQFSTWFKELKENEWAKWYNPAQSKIKELEETYNKKLQLEAPARYWSIKSLKHKKEGKNALWILIGLSTFAAILLYTILWNAPEDIYKSFTGETSRVGAIRWSIVFITLISIIAFAIKSVSKYMFSSFHLARDCEERHTLTYFYLSLLKDSNVDEKDRQLIMQSLFSRADTGLLKEDSSPTMPNDILTKISHFK